MSKMKASSHGDPAMTQHSQSIAPTMRIVHIIPPKVFKTDPANFGALVQKLTGKHSALLSRQSFKKSKQKKKNPVMSARRSKSGYREKLSYIGQDEFTVDHFSSNQPAKTKLLSQDEFVTTFAQVESESVEDSLTWCDNFSCLFGVFDELEMFSTQMHSDSMLPEFLTVDVPVTDHTDAHSAISGRA
ncbi:hypothetical protein SUGI_0422520 [Cryptomeria japonica]|nr:hypothetical protein SUGI_0422520 [Cryptomeria japonica]